MELHLRCRTEVSPCDSPPSGANAGALTHPLTHILLTQPDSLVPRRPPELQAAQTLGLNIPAPRRRGGGGQVEGGQAGLFPAALTHRGNPLSATLPPSAVPPPSFREWPCSRRVGTARSSPFPPPAPSAAPKLDFPHVSSSRGSRQPRLMNTYGCSLGTTVGWINWKLCNKTFLLDVLNS